MKKKSIVLLGSLLILVFFGLMDAAGEDLEATIKSFGGEVEVKLFKVERWEPARVGMVLGKGDSLSTGFDSQAQLAFQDNSQVSVDSLTLLTINEFFREDMKVRTNLGVKIGGVRAKVKKGPEVI